MIHFTISFVNLRNRKEICFLINCVHCAVIHCMIARLCEYDNFFTYPTILALQNKKQALFNPKTHKNRRHPTKVECRLLLLSNPVCSCRFRNFLKLLSYQHTAMHGGFLHAAGGKCSAEDFFRQACCNCKTGAGLVVFGWGLWYDGLE